MALLSTETTVENSVLIPEAKFFMVAAQPKATRATRRAYSTMFWPLSSVVKHCHLETKFNNEGRIVPPLSSLTGCGLWRRTAPLHRFRRVPSRKGAKLGNPDAPKSGLRQGGGKGAADRGKRSVETCRQSLHTSRRAESNKGNNQSILDQILAFFTARQIL